MLSQGKARMGKHKAGTKANKERSGPLSDDAVKLFKTQDANYLRDAIAQGRKEMGKLKQEVCMDTITITSKGQTKRTVFKDDSAEEPQRKKRKSNADILEPSTAIPTTIPIQILPLKA